MSDLDARRREALAGALADEGWCCDPYGHEDGPPAHGQCSECDRLRLSTADALAPLVAGWVAEAGCELQRTGDGTHGPLIRQAKAEAWDDIGVIVLAFVRVWWGRR